MSVSVRKCFGNVGDCLGRVREGFGSVRGCLGLPPSEKTPAAAGSLHVERSYYKVSWYMAVETELSSNEVKLSSNENKSVKASVKVPTRLN